jgi:uncharacterized protein (TIGR02646 family)
LKRFLKRRKEDPSATFSWPDYKGKSLREHLLPALRSMTQGHCAYCDHFELGVDGARATIDHFRPKGDPRFWHLAYSWQNLFPCCDLCQGEKAERFSDDALAPDDTAYSFQRFFVVDLRTGELQPNPAANPLDQNRARATIAWLGLNRARLPESRRRWYKRFYQPEKRDLGDHPALEQLPYRFLAPPATHPPPPTLAP